MRVLYDGIVFQNAHQRGIQRVFCELFSRAEFIGIDPVLALSERARAELPPVHVHRVGWPGAGLLPRKLRRRVQERGPSPAMKRLAATCDLFHSTYFTLPPVAPVAPPRRMPTVLHVHDMIAERFVDYFTGRNAEAEIERKRRAIESADAIITISNATARELEAFYPETRGRITTVYLGHEHLLESATAKREDTLTALPHSVNALLGHEFGERTEYALYVGDRAGYKNFGVLLDAMDLADWPDSLALVVAGPAWRANEQFRVERLATRSPQPRQVIHAGRVSEASLRALYSHAAATIVTSRVEGFGLSVLEGQIGQDADSLRGGLVLVSDIPVFREIAAPALDRVMCAPPHPSALFFDPSRPLELAQQARAAMDPDGRRPLRAAALVNAQRFSWNICAREIAGVYQRVLTRT